MTIKRDSSTLLLLRDDTSNLLCTTCCGSASGDCEYCDTTPSTVKVYIDDVTLCECFSSILGLAPYPYCGSYINQRGKFSGNLAAVLEGEHELTQTAGNACAWHKTITTGISASIHVYDGDSDCATETDQCYEDEIDSVQIILQRLFGGGYGHTLWLTIYVYYALSYRVYSGYWDMDDGDACVDSTGTKEDVSCSTGSNWIDVGSWHAWGDVCDYAAWSSGASYGLAARVKNGGTCYGCYNPHTSSASDEPGVGANWEDYWIEFT